MSVVRAIVVLAALCAAFGCTDLAQIGALCPLGCTPGTSERVCQCSMASAGKGGSAAADGGSVREDAAMSMSAADSGASCNSRGNLIVALDASASLLPWWPALLDGFQRFIRDDGSRGLGVGLLSFDDVCDTAPYLSMLVPIAELPDNLAALQANIPTTAAATTSTIPVFKAALQTARDFLSAHPNERVDVLLITDASPGVCDGLTGMADAELARSASEAFTGTPSIATYAIGGDSLAYIGPLAMAGGTQAIMIPPLGTSDDVLNALRTIRSTLSACAPLP